MEWLNKFEERIRVMTGGNCDMTTSYSVEYSYSKYVDELYLISDYIELELDGGLAIQFFYSSGRPTFYINRELIISHDRDRGVFVSVDYIRNQSTSWVSEQLNGLVGCFPLEISPLVSAKRFFI